MQGKLKEAQSSFSNALSGAKTLGQHESAEKAQEGLTRVMQLQLEKERKKAESDSTSNTDN